MRVHDSQAYRKIDVTRERISLMLELREILLSIQTGFTPGVRQGCLLSPILLNIFLERIMTDALEDHESTVSIEGRTSTNLCFADDIHGLAGEEK